MKNSNRKGGQSAVEDPSLQESSTHFDQGKVTLLNNALDIQDLMGKMKDACDQLNQEILSIPQGYAQVDELESKFSDVAKLLESEDSYKSEVYLSQLEDHILDIFEESNSLLSGVINKTFETIKTQQNQAVSEKKVLIEELEKTKAVQEDMKEKIKEVNEEAKKMHTQLEAHLTELEEKNKNIVSNV